MAKVNQRRCHFGRSDVASPKCPDRTGGTGYTGEGAGERPAANRACGAGGFGMAPAPADAGPLETSIRNILNVPDIPFEPGPRPRTCQWVTSEGAPWTFCDAPVAHAGSSFCAHHHARAWYIPPPKAPGSAPSA
jgi:hypothetical protein